MRGSLASAMALSLALLACNEAEAPSPDAASETGAPAEPVAAPADAGKTISSPAELAGEYRVAGVGGEAIDLPYAITASIDRDRILLSADCVNIEWAYILADGHLQAARVPTEGCARGLTRVEGALVEAFDGAERITRNASNGYEFTGRGPTAVLYTQ